MIQTGFGTRVGWSLHGRPSISPGNLPLTLRHCFAQFPSCPQRISATSAANTFPHAPTCAALESEFGPRIEVFDPQRHDRIRSFSLGNERIPMSTTRPDRWGCAKVDNRTASVGRQTVGRLFRCSGRCNREDGRLERLRTIQLFVHSRRVYWSAAKQDVLVLQVILFRVIHQLQM